MMMGPPQRTTQEKAKPPGAGTLGGSSPLAKATLGALGVGGMGTRRSRLVQGHCTWV